MLILNKQKDFPFYFKRCKFILYFINNRSAEYKHDTNKLFAQFSAVFGYVKNA